VGEEQEVKLRSFSTPSDVTVTLPEAVHVYDSRTGKYHGRVREFGARFDPADALLCAALPYRVMGLVCRPAGKLRAGADARLAVELRVRGGPAGRHVVRCDVYDPRGEWCSPYSKNVVAERGRGELVVPFAESDPPGSWRVELRDAVSGQKAAVRLKVAAAR
jgi:hypothetical protein